MGAQSIAKAPLPCAIILPPAMPVAGNRKARQSAAILVFIFCYGCDTKVQVATQVQAFVPRSRVTTPPTVSFVIPSIHLKKDKISCFHHARSTQNEHECNGMCQSDCGFCHHTKSPSLFQSAIILAVAVSTIFAGIPASDVMAADTASPAIGMVGSSMGYDIVDWNGTGSGGVPMPQMQLANPPSPPKSPAEAAKTTTYIEPEDERKDAPSDSSGDQSKAVGNEIRDDESERGSNDANSGGDATIASSRPEAPEANITEENPPKTEESKAEKEAGNTVATEAAKVTDTASRTESDSVKDDQQRDEIPDIGVTWYMTKSSDITRPESGPSKTEYDTTSSDSAKTSSQSIGSSSGDNAIGADILDEQTDATTAELTERKEEKTEAPPPPPSTNPTKAFDYQAAADDLFAKPTPSLPDSKARKNEAKQEDKKTSKKGKEPTLAAPDPIIEDLSFKLYDSRGRW